MRMKKINKLTSLLLLFTLGASLFGNTEKQSTSLAITIPDPTIGTISGSAVTPAYETMSLTFNEKKIDTGATPIVFEDETYMIPFEPLLCKKGPRLFLEYGDRKHIKLVRENYVFTFFFGDSCYYSKGRKYSFTKKPFKGTYQASGKSYYFVPLKDLCKALGLTYSINTTSNTCHIKGAKVPYTGKKTHTKYAYSNKSYAKKQYRSVKRVSLAQYMKYVSTAKDTTHNFKYLRVDRYRPVNKKSFKAYYQYLIEDYCRQVKINPKKSVLYGKADTFLKTAKKYKLDPVYLVSQTFLESAYGTSWLASGNRIKKIALRSYKRNKKGKFITKKIKKTTKVYNLYGIKAYDSDPYVGATSYAYYHGWTSVNKAIRGAAKYLRSNYIGSPYKQNTVFKMRYTFRRSIWHQYATGPDYAESIGNRMYQMSSVYSGKAKFLFDYPKYR